MDSLRLICHVSSTGELERRDTGVSQKEHSRTDLAFGQLLLNHLGGLRAVVQTHPAVGNLLHALNLGLGISGKFVGCKRAGSDQHSHIHPTFGLKKHQGQFHTRAAASGCAVNCTESFLRLYAHTHADAPGQKDATFGRDAVQKECRDSDVQFMKNLPRMTSVGRMNLTPILAAFASSSLASSSLSSSTREVPTLRPRAWGRTDQQCHKRCGTL